MRHPPRDRKNKICDGPPKKRSPASAATERGAEAEADRKNSKSVSHKTSTKQCRSTQESNCFLHVYDGRVRLASITGNVGDFVVVMANGALLGSFKTLGKASAAISTAHGGGL
jgi:hypothetical protein